MARDPPETLYHVWCLALPHPAHPVWTSNPSQVQDVSRLSVELPYYGGHALSLPEVSSSRNGLAVRAGGSRVTIAKGAGMSLYLVC